MFLELRECKARSNSVSEGSKYLLTPTSYFIDTKGLIKMRKLTTNAVAMLLALVGCMGCGNRSASSVDNLIRVDVMADYPEKEWVVQDFLDVEYIPLETNEEFITSASMQAIGKNLIILRNKNGQLMRNQA